ncbi:MAG: sugar isomerase domain-containing protein, partial [Candidatus Bipolaricaulota bacterium]
MGAKSYWSATKKCLQAIENDYETIKETAKVLHEVVRSGDRIFVFGCAHSVMLAEEVMYRAGGLALWNPIHAPGLKMDIRPISYTTAIERLEGYGDTIVEKEGLQEGDALVLVSTSGRNPVPVDVALAAKERGVKVIALTSLEYSKNVDSRNSSGKKVYEIADLVLDNQAPEGDAVGQLTGKDYQFGGVSLITGTYILHAIEGEIAELMIDEGEEPPIFLSSNLPDGVG